MIDQTLLGASPDYLRQSVAEAPGLRVPGAWDGFETAVRAVLGQQVSVARGTELANRMIVAYGEGDFPGPESTQISRSCGAWYARQSRQGHIDTCEMGR